MADEWTLRLYNPSQYERTGFVTVPFYDILGRGQVAPEKPLAFTLHDGEGTAIPFQIDSLDAPEFSHQTLSRAALVFYLSHGLSPGPEDYSKPSGTVLLKLDSTQDNGMPSRHASQAAGSLDGKLGIEVFPTKSAPTRLELTNSQLVISFSLRPSSNPKALTETWWYSGSATSVRLDGIEMLERWNCHSWTGHDPEKRCMQIDRIRVERHPSNLSTPQEFSLFDRPYELISHSSGPVRASITLASESFEYSYDDSRGKRQHLKCRFFRVISLYANVDYVVEELFLRDFPRNSTEFDISFSARYFACMDIGFTPCIYHFANVPDWFAVGRPDGYPQERHPGYGFACDAHVHVPLANPHPHYHDSGKAHKTFSWQLHPCKKATCLHLFMHGTPGGFDSRIGHHWYEHIYKPLRARP